MKLLHLALASVFLLLAVPFFRGSGRSFELDGVLRPSRVVDVVSATGGVLASVPVDRGDVVTEGQLLAELDMGVERAVAELALVRSRRVASARTAEIELAREEDELSEHQALFEDGILSSEDLRETRAERDLARYALIEAREELKVAEHEHRRARAVVDRGRTRSPLAGVVVERFRSPGELAEPNADAPIVRIARLDPLAVEAAAPADLFGAVRPGMRVEVRVDGSSGRTRVGRVTAVDRIVDTASATFGVRIEIANPDHALPAGLRCRVRLLGE